MANFYLKQTNSFLLTKNYCFKRFLHKIRKSFKILPLFFRKIVKIYFFFICPKILHPFFTKTRANSNDSQTFPKTKLQAVGHLSPLETIANQPRNESPP
jgi:hypothetical protein